MGVIYGTTEPIIVKNGLVFYLDAGNSASYGGSGSTWSDISGNGNNGTIDGATYSSNEGGYFNFDGSNDEVVMNNSDDNSDFTIGTGPFSFEAWLYLDTAISSGSEMYVGGADNSGGSSSKGVIVKYGNVSGTMRFKTQLGITGYEVAVTIPTSTCTYMAVASRSDNTFFTNKNGVDVYTNTNTSDVGEGTNSFMIGNGFFSSREWDGRIAIVRYSVGGSLSELQTKQNYNAQRWRFNL